MQAYARRLCVTNKWDRSTRLHYPRQADRVLCSASIWHGRFSSSQGLLCQDNLTHRLRPAAFLSTTKRILRCIDVLIRDFDSPFLHICRQ